MPTPVPPPEGDEGRVPGFPESRVPADPPNTSGNKPAGPVKGKGEHLPPDPVDVAKDGQG